MVTPKKMSCLNSVTANRGVEAKEFDGVNTRFELEGSNYSHATAASASDHSASYLQVVVQKHRARRPAASSPAPRQDAASGDGPPPAVLLACPAFAALHQQAWKGGASLEAGDAQPASLVVPPTGVPADDAKIDMKESFWKKCAGFNRQEENSLRNGARAEPDRVEVYYGEPDTRLERALRPVGALLSALLAELLAVPRLLLALPLAVLLQTLRCALGAVRAVLEGAALALGEALLLPLGARLLRLLLSALGAAARAARAGRGALRPLLQLAGDALEPLTRVRLVHLERRCCCGPQSA